MRRRRGSPEEMSNHPFRSLFDLMVALVFILIGALVLQNGNTFDARPLQNELLFLHNLEIKETASHSGRNTEQYYTSLSQLPKGDPCRSLLANGGVISAEQWRILQAHTTQMWQTLAPYFNDVLHSETVTVNYGQDQLHFASGSAIPIYPTQIHPILQDAYQKCRQGFTRIRVEGNTDDIPIHNRMYPSNWELSAARAIWVAKQIENYLISNRITIGSKGVFVEAIGFGDSKPLVPNNTSSNRAQNRRIDIVYQK